MRLAVSNIAWDRSEDEKIFAAMKAAGFTGLEIAPGRTFTDPFSPAVAEISAFAAKLAEYGIVMAGMQSLFFGRPELKLFGDGAARAAMRACLDGLAEVASAAGISTMVLGAPKNRATGGKDRAAAFDEAASFFRDAGDHCAARGVAICIEANPVSYGTDFINTTAEAAEFVRLVGSKGFGLHLDSGAMIMNGEDVEKVLETAAPIARHFHVSEPELLPVPQKASLAFHRRIAAALARSGYGGWISVEMRRDPSSPVESVERALEFAASVYGAAVN